MLTSFFRCHLSPQTFILGLIACLAIALNSPAQAGADQKLQSGGWHGYKVYDSSGRALKGCYLFGPRDGQVFLGVRMMPNGERGLLLRHDSWSLPTGDVYDLTISFDGMQRISTKAEALGDHTLYIDFTAGGPVEEGFSRGNELVIAAARAVYHFPLRGSARALSTVTQCFQRPRPTARPPSGSGGGSSTNPFGEGAAPDSGGGGGGGGGGRSNPFGTALPNSGEDQDTDQPPAPYLPPGPRNDVWLAPDPGRLPQLLS